MQKFKALLVEEVAGKQFQASVTERDLAELPEGDVLIRVQYSSPVSYSHLSLRTICSV